MATFRATDESSVGEANVRFGIAEIIYIVVFLALTAFWIWMLVDAVRTPNSEFRSGTTIVWVLVIVLLGWIGALIYLLVGRPTQRSTT